MVPIVLAGVVAVLVTFHVVRRWTGDLAAAPAAGALGPPRRDRDLPQQRAGRRHDPLSGPGGRALRSALRPVPRRGSSCLGAARDGLPDQDARGFRLRRRLPLVYLLFGPPKLGRRLVQLLWAALVLVIASGWWVAVVELWPVGRRPDVDSSGDNSEVSLIFGYNGFGRLLGMSNLYRISLPHNRLASRLSDLITSATHFGSQPGWPRHVRARPRIPDQLADPGDRARLRRRAVGDPATAPNPLLRPGFCFGGHGRSAESSC